MFCGTLNCSSHESASPHSTHPSRQALHDQRPRHLRLQSHHKPVHSKRFAKTISSTPPGSLRLNLETNNTFYCNNGANAIVNKPLTHQKSTGWNCTILGNEWSQICGSPLVNVQPALHNKTPHARNRNGDQWRILTLCSFPLCMTLTDLTNKPRANFGKDQYHDISSSTSCSSNNLFVVLKMHWDIPICHGCIPGAAQPLGKPHNA